MMIDFEVLQFLNTAGSTPCGRPLNILEFGSGYGTHILIDMGFKVVSIEEDPEWAFKYHDDYILCPLDEKTGWYDTKVLTREVLDSFLPDDAICWDVVIIDGPTQNNREKFLENAHLIRGMGYSLVIVDDINRPEEKKIFEAVCTSMLEFRKQIPLKTFVGVYGLESLPTEKQMERYNAFLSIKTCAFGKSDSHTAAVIS